jgi:hypothetical protein
MPSVIKYKEGILPIILDKFDYSTFQRAIWVMIGDNIDGNMISKEVRENMLEHIYFFQHSEIACNPVRQEDLDIFARKSMPILPNLLKIRPQFVSQLDNTARYRQV